jgi:hypothetical protein
LTSVAPLLSKEEVGLLRCEKKENWQIHNHQLISNLEV